MRHVELLQRPQPGHGFRERPLQLVEAQVQDSELPELPDLLRDAGLHATVEDHELVQRPGHLADAWRDATAELPKVCEHDDRSRRVAEILR